ncbi:MAG TPA: threonine/serine dehydratase [Thermomicrobiaceae bacterium]|nr:threonine/serine dehydratase [Thermomicrobiaceae bacterium]
MVTLEDIVAARAVVAPRVHRTPLVGSAALGHLVGAPLYLKLECWQKTGSFKPRGVLTKIAALNPEERQRGLITASAGNHAQALAWAAGAAGVPCTVVMPSAAPATKIAATQGYGATVVLEPDRMALFSHAIALADEHGYTFVPPFDDPAIVAGQGTVGLEVLEDLPDVGTVVVPIGGGGLISGIALAIKSQRPATRIVGVEPEGAPKMWRSRREGHAVHLDRVQTIADGLSAPFAGELPFSLVERYVDDLVLVTDDEIRRGMALILERCKVLAEPAGAAALAALLTGAATFRPGEPVVAIVSGGNTDVAGLGQLLAGTAR